MPTMQSKRARKIERLTDARALDARLKGLARSARAADAALASGLLEMKRLGHFRVLGYSRLQDYAEAELDLTRSKAKALVEIATRLESLPRVRAEFEAGELPWTKARQVGRVATPESEERWLARAHCLSNRGLEEEVAREKGEAPRVRIVLELSASDAADLDDAIRALREERSEALDLGAAVVELCRRAMGPPADRPGHQIVIHECQTCAKASRDAFDGPIEVAPADVAAAKVDAEILDLRPSAPESVPRQGRGRRLTIKPAERRAIRARDRDRCVLCGSRAWLHIHHVERRAGDPAVLSLLCSACHKRLVHAGHVQMTGRGPAFDIRLEDGTAAPGAPRKLTG